MKRVERFINFEQSIKEGYFPKLDSLVASRSWPARVARQKLSNLRRETEQIVLDCAQLKVWRDRIYEAISSGMVKNVSIHFNFTNWNVRHLFFFCLHILFRLQIKK